MLANFQTSACRLRSQVQSGRPPGRTFTPRVRSASKCLQAQHCAQQRAARYAAPPLLLTSSARCVRAYALGTAEAPRATEDKAGAVSGYGMSVADLARFSEELAELARPSWHQLAAFGHAQAAHGSLRACPVLSDCLHRDSIVALIPIYSQSKLVAGLHSEQWLLLYTSRPAHVSHNTDILPGTAGR